MTKKKVLRFLETLKASDSLMEEIFTKGSCYQLFLILRSIWSDAECFYDPIEPHIYTKIGNNFYDINGVHYFKNKKIVPMDIKNKKPHRWKTKGLYYEKSNGI